jgi:hypothetical protein
LNGLNLVKHNIRATYMVLEALRACDRLFKKLHAQITRYPTGTLPTLIYDMYGTIPLTAHLLRTWAEETPETEAELCNRIDSCIAILHQELRANGVFERLNAGPAHI